MKSKRHTLTITVAFDKPCSARHARHEVANCIHGEFDCDSYYNADADPESFKVRRVGHLPKENPCKP